MFYTSNFAKSRKIEGKRLVSISNITPKWFTGERYFLLAPNWDTIEAWKKSEKTEEDWKNYKRDYEKTILSKLNPLDIIEKFGDDDVVFLCYEKEQEPCHRHIFAEWMKKELNIDVKEI